MNNLFYRAVVGIIANRYSIGDIMGISKTLL